MTLSPLTVIGLVAALFSLLVGLMIFWRVNPRSDKYLTSVRICLALIVLFLVLVIFSFYPSTTELKGDVFGLTLTATGSFAAFFALWWAIDRKTVDVIQFDKLRSEKNLLEDEVSKKNAEIAALKKQPQMLLRGERHVYAVRANKKKKITLITGGMEHIKNVDALVNSENTQMIMSRPLERSVSGVLRFYGGERDAASNTLVRDIIAQEVHDEMERRGIKRVDPAGVIVTSAGQLGVENNVKAIFHVASVEGQAGFGFRPIADIGRCVTNVMTEAAKRKDIKSIVFPLMGTGQAEGDVLQMARELLTSAIGCFQQHRDTPIEEVFFALLRKSDLDACTNVLKELPVDPVRA